MTNEYGYTRVSTKTQNLERQIRNIKALAPLAELYADKFSGTTSERPQWKKLLNKVKSGDTITFDSVSRMSRNAEQGVKQYFELIDNGVNLKFIKEPHIDSAVYGDKIKSTDDIRVSDELLDSTILDGIRKYLRETAAQQITIAFEQAEKEVFDLRQRVREGMALSDKLAGAPKGNTNNQKKVPSQLILDNYSGFNGALNKSQLAKMLDVSRPTLNKWIAKLEKDSV